MRLILGDGYTEALRKILKQVPESSDFVMYWWEKSASLIHSNSIKRFGLITTNSLTQTFNRIVIEKHFHIQPKLSLIFAIPDHPWVNEGAAVRIAMTVVESGDSEGILLNVENESEIELGISKINFSGQRGKIQSDLSAGANLANSFSLRANERLSNQGVTPLGTGFRLSQCELSALGFTKKNMPSVVKSYIIGKDLVQGFEEKFIIDFFGLSLELAQKRFPSLFQIVLEKVKPEREQKKRKSYRDNWWIFAEPRSTLRPAIESVKRYIGTCRTAKHRVFLFIESAILPDAKIIAIGLDDAYCLGILSSQIHVIWAIKTGSWLGVGNDSNYNHSDCFGKFPFPDPTPDQKQKIRDLGERLDAHRKNVQAAHPDITITGMYNLLEKLRNGEQFTDKDRDYNDRALVSTLKQIHDELDLAVLDAYGWAHDITDEQILENLVTLNAQRAEEERNGLIRWLRPEYQAPDQIAVQTELVGIRTPEEPIIEPVEQQKWPTQPKAQLAAIRDLLRTTSGDWTTKQIAAQFKGRITQTKLDTITENLERLEWFGLVIPQKIDGIMYWRFADSANVA
jgi:hypothetical protein